MHDWFVTVLISVRDMAANSGMTVLAEEMDIAILVAANESHEKELADLGTIHVTQLEPNTREAGSPTGTGSVRRYH